MSVSSRNPSRRPSASSSKVSIQTLAATTGVTAQTERNAAMDTTDGFGTTAASKSVRRASISSQRSVSTASRDGVQTQLQLDSGEHPGFVDTSRSAAVTLDRPQTLRRLGTYEVPIAVSTYKTRRTGVARTNARAQYLQYYQTVSNKEIRHTNGTNEFVSRPINYTPQSSDSSIPWTWTVPLRSATVKGSLQQPPNTRLGPYKELQHDGSVVIYGAPAFETLTDTAPIGAFTVDGKKQMAMSWQRWLQKPVKQMDASGREVAITAPDSE